MIYVVSILLALYIYALYAQNKVLESTLSAARADVKNAEQQLFDTVEKILGKDTLGKLQKQKLWQGMPAPLVCYVLGKPLKTKEEVSEVGTFSYWYFDQEFGSVDENFEWHEGEYNTEVYIYDGFVTGWKSKQ